MKKDSFIDEENKIEKKEIEKEKSIRTNYNKKGQDNNLKEVGEWNLLHSFLFEKN